jgi:hypothetical protein
MERCAVEEHHTLPFPSSIIYLYPIAMYLLDTMLPTGIYGRVGFYQVLDGFLLIHKSFVRACSGRSNQHGCPPDALFIPKLVKDVCLSLRRPSSHLQWLLMVY